ncbi:hypothetical protein PMZ80_001569 [Knufia obscura]|uniref:Zinc/iron permease n=2 Tax=Knufia TaxID=430999 RepID=A0AAN8EX76_9EURO|nr:hypothetical protein PMZ80_001569 [Knufia obscura]KAK5955606.1 hypothetical protein OHC33_003247 [Knufia fluminis]
MTRALGRRQEDLICSSGESSGQYNLSLQIGALFTILAVSASACAFPLIVARIPRLRLPLKFLFVVRHFGTGVLIATAFVHLLPTAFVSLTNPCLPQFWTESYPAMTGAIALASVFAITSIEMLLSPGRNCCSATMLAEQHHEKPVTVPTRSRGIATHVGGAEQLGPLYGRSKPGRTYSNGRGFGRMVSQDRSDQDRVAPIDDQDVDLDESAQVATATYKHDPELAGVVILSEDQKRNKAALQCVLLEIGILFHSVFIGMSLAVSVGSDMTILLVAIAFHQLFEGLALGSRIATVPWTKNRALQPWLMALAYGCTTPIGQAIGIATSDLYDPDSTTGLLVVGIMNAVSAGLLTYTSLVDLLSEDFLSDESWKVLKGNRRMVAFSLVFLGAFLMSLIGAWA